MTAVNRHNKRSLLSRQIKLVALYSVLLLFGTSITGLTYSPTVLQKQQAYAQEVEICDDFFDNDGDFLADFVDPDCATPQVDGGGGEAVPPATTITQEEICDNFFDDDGDGLTDLADISDCSSGMGIPSTDGNMTGEPFAPASTTSAEVCDNFVDDDGDGFADAEDPEGCSLPSGGGNETSSEGFGDSLTPGSILPPETQSLTRYNGYAQERYNTWLWRCNSTLDQTMGQYLALEM